MKKIGVRGSHHQKHYDHDKNWCVKKLAGKRVGGWINWIKSDQLVKRAEELH